MEWYFGYPPVENNVLNWGARAIYQRGTLDFLPDRQQFSEYKGGKHKELRQAMADAFNQIILPRLKEFLPYMPGHSGEFVELVFDFPAGPGDDKLVLRACPNSSHGYLYLSIGLVPMAFVPKQETYPKGYKTLEERQRLEEEGCKERDHFDDLLKKDRQRRSSSKKAFNQEMENRIANATRKEPDEVLDPGDHFRLWANQAYRDAFCLKVDGDQSLCEYFMPSGKRQLIVYGRIVCSSESPNYKTYSEKSLPKKWRS